jgi:hypothetical protein
VQVQHGRVPRLDEIVRAYVTRRIENEADFSVISTKLTSKLKELQIMDWLVVMYAPRRAKPYGAN